MDIFHKVVPFYGTVMTISFWIIMWYFLTHTFSKDTLALKNMYQWRTNMYQDTLEALSIEERLILHISKGWHRMNKEAMDREGYVGSKKFINKWVV